MRIGIIGAGATGTAIARYAIAAGHEILMASRGKQKLAAVVEELGNAARAVSVDGMLEAEMIVLAFPRTAREEVLGRNADWAGKVVIDAINPYVDMTRLILADLGEAGSSEIISSLLPGTRLVKAFMTRNPMLECNSRHSGRVRITLACGDEVPLTYDGGSPQ
jgi:8-hydroxy-5-deazaflavin:NADPH oxidoreductase